MLPLVLGSEMGAIVEGFAVIQGLTVSAGNFHAWMLAEQKRIFQLCQHMLQDQEDADAATQDTFLKAWLALEKDGATIDEPARWLTRIAINTCLDRLRSRRWQFWRKRPSSQDESLILSMAPDEGPTPEDHAFAKEIGRRLATALPRLSPKQKAVFSLRHYEDRSLEEIAGLLDLELGTVKSHLARALEKLREELRDLYSRKRNGERS